MRDMEQCKRIIEKYASDAEFCGSVSQKQILDAESKLQNQFPADYKSFLLEYGAGNFRSFEVYGIVKDCSVEMVPNGIWATMYLRMHRNLPSSMIVVGFDGCDQYYCIDTGQVNQDGNHPVISYDLDTRVIKKENNSFAEFLLFHLKEQIDMMQGLMIEE